MAFFLLSLQWRRQMVENQPLLLVRQEKKTPTWCKTPGAKKKKKSSLINEGSGVQRVKYRMFTVLLQILQKYICSRLGVKGIKMTNCRVYIWCEKAFSYTAVHSSCCRSPTSSLCLFPQGLFDEFKSRTTNVHANKRMEDVSIESFSEVPSTRQKSSNLWGDSSLFVAPVQKQDHHTWCFWDCKLP